MVQETIIQAHLPLWIALVIGIIAIYLALKIAHFLLKCFFILISLGALAVAAWWLLNH